MGLGTPGNTFSRFASIAISYPLAFLELAPLLKTSLKFVGCLALSGSLGLSCM